MSLDPQRITPSISLNRVQLIDLPGLMIDPEVKGQTGFGLVSATALTQLIRQHSDELQLDPNMDDHALHLALDDCFASEQAIVRTAAERVGRRIGRNMGYILLTLKRGDAVNRAARREWDDSYWTYWGKIKRVWLGGGLVSGRLGPAIKQHALAVLKEAGVSDYVISISPFASALPLVGAARLAPPGCQTALVFDFGGTMIKYALAIYRNNQLTTLHCLPSQPTEWTKIEQALDDPTQQASHLFNRMISAITNAWHHAESIGLLPVSPIMVSVAAYVRDGCPVAAQAGAYVQLGRITDNLQIELARQVSRQLGETIAVTLIHDGTAAATTYAGMKDTAVITIGTALGIGFPPKAAGLLSINDKIIIAS
jgi:hypothetical protein